MEMNAKEIIDTIIQIPPQIRDTAILVVLLSLIEISPLEVNPWKWVRSFVELPSRLETLEKEFKKDRAFRWRSQILRRADYAMAGQKFSRETWEDTKDTMRRYKTYCEANPSYKNGKAEFAMDFLTERYHKAIENNDFLDREEILKEVEVTE